MVEEPIPSAAPASAPPSVETPVAPDSGGAVLGHTDGNLPPGADAPVSASAAVSPPQTESAPKPEAPGGGETLLAEAKAAEAEKSAEPEKPAPPVERPLPTYDAFTLPEGTQLGDEQVGKFTGLLGEYENRLAADPTTSHATMQELGQKLVDFYLAESQEANQRYARFQNETWNRTREDWVKQFRADPDLGGSKQDATLQSCGDVLALYGREMGPEKETALRDVFRLTGAGDHPEMLRFVNWAARRSVEHSRVIAAPPRPMTAGQTRANRLYRNSVANGGA